jgi:hypothetical protein
MSKTRTDSGDGPYCEETPGTHGRLYVMESGRLWCPVTAALFGEARWDERKRTFVPGPLVVRPYISPLRKEARKEPQPELPALEVELDGD